MPEALSDEQLDQLIDDWHAANYLPSGRSTCRTCPRSATGLGPVRAH